MSLTEPFHKVRNLIRGCRHLIGHIVQEGCLHPVGLLRLTVGYLQFLMTGLEICRQLLLFSDIGGQRLLHLLEVPLQLSDLVLTIRVRNRLVVVSLGDAPD